MKGGCRYPSVLDGCFRGEGPGGAAASPRGRRSARLEDFAKTGDDRAFLTHWLHNRGTAAGLPYEKRARELLPGDAPGLPAGAGVDDDFRVCEQAGQLFFPEIFDVPFPPPERPRFTFIDLFAGIGGFRIALQNCGGKCVFSSEWDAAAQKTYLENFGEMPFGDITKKETKDAVPGGFDVLCAGFPCQPFSISGKMKGFLDARGTLFFDVCEIVKAHQPRVVLLENVKHLVHHDKGRTLAAILGNLRLLGYTPSWRLLNASDFGVSQNRERIIIVAVKGRAFDFGAIPRQKRVALKGSLDAAGAFEFLRPDSYTLIDSPRMQPSGLIFAGYRNKAIRKSGVRPGTENLSRVHKQPNRIYSVLGVHPTLPSQESSGRFFILLEDNRVRKLTIRECYKLMGFPDRFIASPSLSDRYRQIGNSVCVSMVEAVVKALLSENMI